MSSLRQAREKQDREREALHRSAMRRNSTAPLEPPHEPREREPLREWPCEPHAVLAEKEESWRPVQMETKEPRKDQPAPSGHLPMSSGELALWMCLS